MEREYMIGKRLNIKRIAILLSIALVFGLIPSASFADSTEIEKPVNYVAFGDSMSKGFMFLDYNTNHNRGAWQGSSEKSSIKMFAKYLENSVDSVTFTDLSLEGFKPDDLIALLNNDTSKLSAKSKQFFDDWAPADGTGIFANFDEMSSYYRQAIINADVITYDIGINFFGSYLSSRIAGMVNDDVENIASLMNCLTDRQKKQAIQIRKAIKKELSKNESIKNISTYVDMLTYAYAAYIYFTDKCIDWIYKNNHNPK